MKHRLGLVQMVSSAGVDANLARVESLIAEAAIDAVAVFLPENFAALAARNPVSIGRAETDSTGPIRQFLSKAASKNKCWIFGGTIPIATRPDGAEVPNGRVRAASIVYDAAGREVCRYDKIHMFDVTVADNQNNYVESSIFEPGEDVIALETPFGRTGMTVCYDLRFPELYRKLFGLEVDLIAAPSAFTEVTGEAHFELLMRARAVENSCFMVAACQGGIHDSGRQTYGHSMVVDPWGDVVGELGQGEGVLQVDIDLARRKELRQRMPFHLQQKLTS